jgi:uracil-DNA glycosylase
MRHGGELSVQFTRLRRLVRCGVIVEQETRAFELQISKRIIRSLLAAGARPVLELPDNRPTPTEFRTCSDFFDRELSLLSRARVFVALGAFAWEAILLHLARRGVSLPRPRAVFAHGAELVAPDAPTVLGCYHVSQQNTQTGRLTPAMFDAVMGRAAAIALTGG